MKTVFAVAGVLPSARRPLFPYAGKTNRQMWGVQHDIWKRGKNPLPPPDEYEVTTFFPQKDLYTPARQGLHPEWALSRKAIPAKDIRDRQKELG